MAELKLVVPPLGSASELDGSGVAESGSSDRAQFLAGQMTRDEFLDLQVERATKHLEGTMAESRLTTLREMLRLQLELDPVLAGLASRSMAVS